ncbi:rho family-interacting cell polarization regulator 2 [Trichonephila clavata]|uniref:Rho family-interacting cell polarization regulator 2 n=1 Tax=Trichonephila clavata TaxID=2740835 RepID=A0A8X6HGC9_TRICU|nr:rho family-interacting cell polarization regulator 2 [Trichonephila clavata]
MEWNGLLEFFNTDNMSLNEKKRSKQLPDIYLTEGICRSKSFAGLSHRRTNSADATFSSGNDITFDGSTTKTLYSTVGATFSPNSSLNSSKNLPWAAWIHAIKTSKSGKYNKSPRPERTQIIFDSVCKGLKNSIVLAKNDISSSRLAFDNVSVSSVMSQGRLYELEKQMKAGERYLKKLEFHLSKLEELKEQYDVQHKIRDGIRSMGYAYILSPGKLKDMALQSVKSEFKECTEVMCAYESNLESLMGTLIFEMIGIQGFARICCGDVFEVIIKHGDQKWKTRGRVIKNGDQIWENKSVTFKSLFDEPLCIKAMEVRGLGKNILLGNKFCETRDLFCAHPQQMTINLNPSGSLKLNLIITWNPLNGTADGTHMIGLPSSSGLSHSYGRHSISQTSMHETDNFSDISLSGKRTLVSDPNICDNTNASFSSESISTSTPNSAIGSPNVETMNKPYQVMDCSISNDDSNDVQKNLLPKNSNLNDSWSALPSDENSDAEVHSISSLDQNLTEVLKNLSIILEDISETYPEIEELSVILEELEKTLKGKSQSTSGSNISISIESALGCFDFLNTAIDNVENEELENVNDRYVENNEMKIADRCLKCDGEIVNDIDKCHSKGDMHFLSISSGKEDIDLVLIDHLLYCTRLVSSLVSVGPFKCVEDITLKKIRQQLFCLEAIMNILMKSSFCICDFFEDGEDDAHQIWTRICGNGLYCVADHFSFEMENELRSIAVLDSYMASIVSPRLVSDILDSSHFDPTSRISVFQFKTYFGAHNKAHSMILEFVADSLAAEDLKCKNVQKAFYAVSVLSKIVPSSYSLFYVGSLLTDSNTDLKNVAISYLKAVCTNDDLWMKVIFSYLKMLHSGNVSSRLISCKALEVLQAKHCVDQLAYVADKDIDASVREAASYALKSFDESMTSEKT